MELPTEILAQIVTNGLDSFATAKSWCKISPYFQAQVKKNLGIVVITDLSMGGTGDSNDPLQYNLLSGDSNTKLTQSDQFDAESANEFVIDYENILIVIESDRAFSDPLLTALTQLTEELVASSVQIRKNVCVVYKTACNFLSKMYFRQFFLSRRLLRLCEFHVLGNDESFETDMCDLDMIFEVTYLHNIQSLYSLNIRSMAHTIIAPHLRMIRQLEAPMSIKLEECLANCPKLSRIGQFKLPSGLGGDCYALPKCDSFTLVNFNPDTHRSIIDGGNVRKELTITTSLKIQSATFTNLNFPYISKLTIELPMLTMGEMNFESCLFPRLRSYDCSSSLTLTNWESLASSGASLETLKVSVSNHKDLQQLKRIPFVISKSLEIVSLRPEELSLNLFENIDLISEEVGWSNLISFCSDIKMTIKTLWDCILLQNLVIPRISSASSLKLDINTSEIYRNFINLCQREVMEGSKILERWNLKYVDGSITIDLPSLRHFVLVEHNIDPHQPISNHTESLGVFGSPSLYTDPMAADLYNNFAISPSEFRRNSLAGIDSATARRNSVLKFEGPRSSSIRKKSSGSYYSGQSPPLPKSSLLTHCNDLSYIHQEFLQLTLFGAEPAPKVITTTMNSLENLLNLQSCVGQIEKLEILLPCIDCKDSPLTHVLSDIYERILDVLHHPVLKASGSFNPREVEIQLPLKAGKGMRLGILLEKLQDLLILKEETNIDVSMSKSQHSNTSLLVMKSELGIK